MEEPSRRTSRHFIALGFAAALALGGAGFVLGRATSPRPPAPAVQAIPLPAPSPTPSEPEAPSRVLGKADLIALSAAASDALAAGQAVPQTVRDAEGRTFELRLPFGCDGPSPEDTGANAWWRYDEATQALRLHAVPLTVQAQAWFPAQLDQVESIEGFWIPRPWTSSDACPAVDRQPREAAGATLPGGQTLMVAQVFPKDGPRQARRKGQPFETVNKTAPDAIDVRQGFVLRLRGRIARLPADSTTQCRQPAGAEQRPVCMIGVSLDEVAFTSADGGQVFATWPMQEVGSR